MCRGEWERAAQNSLFDDDDRHAAAGANNARSFDLRLDIELSHSLAGAREESSI